MSINTPKTFFAFWKEKPLVMLSYGVVCAIIGAAIGAVFL